MDLVFDSESDDAKAQNKKQYQTVVFILPIRKLFKEIDFSSDFEIDAGLEVVVAFDETEVIDQIRMGRAEKILEKGQKFQLIWWYRYDIF